MQNGTKQNSAVGSVRGRSVSGLHLGDAGFARDREAARDQRIHCGQHARLVFSPYSHSLMTAILWSAVAALAYKSLCRWLSYACTKSTTLIVAAAVFSHWILDLIAHPRDLPLYDNKWKVGFGFWNCRDPEFALEIALLAGGIILYLVRNMMPAMGKTAVIAFGLALVIVQIGDTYVPRAPLTAKATAMGVWIFYTLFVVIAFAVEKIGVRRRINAS